jgi:sugar (pentulose or hexulose) kinase
VRVGFETDLRGVAAEIRPEELLGTVIRAGSEALAGGGGGGEAPDAIAYCSFSPGVVVTDAAFRPITPIITHADRRSVAAAGALLEMRPEGWWLERTGNLPYPGGIGSSTLAWLRRARPALFKKAYRVGQVSSLIGSFLSDRASWTIDPSQAVFLGLMDIRRGRAGAAGRWDAEACELVGITSASLPRVRFADSVAGGLGGSVARQWGIAEGVPIVGGFVDTSAAVIQTPMEAGQLAHSSGSTDVLAMCMDRPRPQKGLLTRPTGVGRVMAPRWLLVDTIAASGSLLQWCRGICFSELREAAWRKVVEEQCAAALEAGEEHAVGCELGFVGERAALMAGAGGALRNLRISTTREALLRGILRALLARRLAGYRQLGRIETPGRIVYTMGGASALGAAMHAEWPRRHRFEALVGDGLAGVVLLARKVLEEGGGAG